TGDGAILDVIRNVQIAAAVVMLPVLLLQMRDQSTQRLLLFGHYIGEQKRIQNAIALGKVPRIPDTAGLLATDHDLAFHHEVGNVLEADGTLVEFASMFRGDAVEHARCVESAHHFAGPFFSCEQPFEEYGENLVRVDETAVFCDSADAVGVAVRGKTGMTFLAHNDVLQRAHMRLDWFRVDTREQRVHILANGDEINSVLTKNLRQDPAARAVHGVNREFELGLRDQVEIGKAANGPGVCSLEIY